MTWAPLSFESDQMILQINFTNPLDISGSNESPKDRLNVNVLDRKLLRSIWTTDGVMILDQDSMNAQYPVKKQVPEADAWLSGVASMFGTGIESTSFGSVVLSWFMNGSLAHFLCMFNSL